MKKIIEGEIADLEKILPNLISDNKERALEIIQLIGGNVFLLKNVDFAMLKEVDENLFNNIDLGFTSEGSPGWGSCSGCSYWSGCTGCHTSDSSNGCSGDSGCSSGDSGCSGCGGGCGGGGD